MSTHASATFEITSWDEKPYEQLEGGGKLSRATVAQTYHGDLEGDARTEYLMAYRADGTADFVGLQRLAGRVGQRSGSLVLQLSGTFDGSTAQATWVVVPGAGTGELSGLRGKGGFAAPHGPKGTATLDYDLE